VLKCESGSSVYTYIALNCVVIVGAPPFLVWLVMRVMASDFLQVSCHNS
jgi:hypothetical protein